MLKKKVKGFSLVEVLVVVTIMTILMMSAIGSFSLYQKNFAESRLTSLQKLIELSVVRARTDHRTVVICPLLPSSLNDDGKLYVDSDGNIDTSAAEIECYDTADWNNGAILAFESESDDGKYNGSTDKIIGGLAEGRGNIKVTPARKKITINSVGFLNTPNFTAVYCTDNNEYKAAIVMNMVGRVFYTTDVQSLTCA